MSQTKIFAWATACGLGLCAVSPVGAQTPMQLCGQQFQAAKAANTLNGMSWDQFRTACAAKLKAQPAAAPVAPAAPAPKPSIFSNPLKFLKPTPAPAPAVVKAPAAPVAPAPAPTVVTAPVAPAPPAAPLAPAATTAKAATPLTAGRAAFVDRERQCGAEWRAQKVALTAQQPGLTWPQYLSQCNSRLKAAGQ